MLEIPKYFIEILEKKGKKYIDAEFMSGSKKKAIDYAKRLANRKNLPVRIKEKSPYTPERIVFRIKPIVEKAKERAKELKKQLTK